MVRSLSQTEDKTQDFKHACIDRNVDIKYIKSVDICDGVELCMFGIEDRLLNCSKRTILLALRCVHEKALVMLDHLNSDVSFCPHSYDDVLHYWFNSNLTGTCKVKGFSVSCKNADLILSQLKSTTKSLHLDSIPSDIVKQTHPFSDLRWLLLLTIVNTNVTLITQDMFCGLVSIRTLLLPNCSIHAI